MNVLGFGFVLIYPVEQEREGWGQVVAFSCDLARDLCNILLSEWHYSVLLLIWDSTGGSVLVAMGALLPLPLVDLLLK